MSFARNVARSPPLPSLTRLYTPPFRRRFFTNLSPNHARSPLKTAAYATVFTVSACFFAVYYFDARSALHRHIITQVIRHTLNPELAHKFAIKVLKSGLAPKDPLPDDEILRVKLWEHEICNPVGLAAGFDKDGEAIDGLYNLGFSWVEVGSVTPKPQPGNPKPRVFRLQDDEGLINRYGFPSQGHASVLARLRARLPTFLKLQAASLRPNTLLAVNLGKNKDSPFESIEDYVTGVRVLGPYSDVLVVNVSSPNTPGLRGLQNKHNLKSLLYGVTQARDESAVSPVTAQRPKLMLKIAPDLDDIQLAEIAEVIRESGIDGVIVSNTTIQRPKSLTSLSKNEVGGLSGTPLKPYALQAVRSLRSLLPASIPIIGCGGIRSGADALDYARAGACMVQVYTGFGYEGVGNCRRIKNELVEELRKQNTTWEEIVRAAVEKDSGRKLTKTIDSGIGQLVAEAEELGRLLEEVGRRMEREGESSQTVE
ncbi:hypothetical protein AMATHDRAFT_141278 [Amanita thiersii Skay4041]|uniref:Dihydroorotate dehydrogenase (quinone), mitochondrial n=1 Tax=Amanita thiersii Skay4041 TaxID=703135 RepID=A0A2A9NUG1_9AGAR|nr:hypothetical protein AMATHDRAFT_141278 [Amanita thiersii Skay4041]